MIRMCLPIERAVYRSSLPVLVMDGNEKNVVATMDNLLG